VSNENYSKILRFYFLTTPRSSSGKVFFSCSSSPKIGVFLFHKKDAYVFGSSSFLGLSIFASDGALRYFSTMFGLDVSVESRVGQVSEATSATNKFSAFFIFSGFSHFLLFLIAVLFRHVLIVFDLVVVKHVHFLLGLNGSDNFLVVDFSY
jgi:hypothetical protein